MKAFIFIILLPIFLSYSPRFLQLLRLLSPECNYHGYFYKSTCFCKPEWQGLKCELTRTIGFSDDLETVCDNLLNRLDFLTNISPENYSGDDYEFSRFKNETVGQGNAAYGEKSYTWIKMHDITKEWRIFGGEFRAVDVNQGALGNCYLLAALASLAVHRNGEYIKNIFVTQEDNEKHVYVTRWMIAGKPRFVAVDDYVPGEGKSPSFSGPTADNDYWSMIIEKSWAKIHGNYMITEAGWQTDVWKSLTQAPIFQYYHSTIETPSSIFGLIMDKFSRSFPMGAATRGEIKTEVSNHAYAIIGVFNLTLQSGVNLKLIKMYNPWNTERFWANPWRDDSKNWTSEIKTLVNFNSADDGIFYLTPQDYLKTFYVTNWAEVNPNYEISFVDIPIDNIKLGMSKTYSVGLSIKRNDLNLPIYIYVDIPQSRLLHGCGNPYRIITMSAVNASNSNVKFHQSKYGESVVILDKDGNYKFSATIRNDRYYSKYLTVTAYHPKNVFNFTQNFIRYNENNCSKNNFCNGKGKCNYYSGNCSCFQGWKGDNCSTKVPIPCPQNCNGNGTCDFDTGKCLCKPGTEYPNCKACQDAFYDCKRYDINYCQETSRNFEYMKKNCQQYCGDLGFSNGFGNCYVERNYIDFPCKYFRDIFPFCKTNLIKYCDQNNYDVGCKKSCCQKKNNSSN